MINTNEIEVVMATVFEGNRSKEFNDLFLNKPRRPMTYI